MTTQLSPGDAAPWFRAPTLDGSQAFSFDSVAGRYVVLLFVGSAGSDEGQAALRTLAANRALFDDRHVTFFGVTCDPADAAEGRIEKMLPGVRWFLDYDRRVSRSYGAMDGGGTAHPHWLLLDRALRVADRTDVANGARLLANLSSLVTQPRDEGFAPVLVVPRVFGGDLCRRLIDLYDTHGGTLSGFMREVDGKTVGIVDKSFKRRSDYTLEETSELRTEVNRQLARTLLPQIQRAFQFRATRIERYIVACYDGEGDGGYFRAHRDNTTAGTAHRRFACTINLNAGDYDGGDLIFPEYGDRRYRAPTGGAVVFSCSLLHEAMPVTRGRRYAYLPFLYDDAAAQVREANAKSGRVSSELASYRA
ncbi:redoxin domain-containing protein [Sphingomonas sp. SRS2]|uniref:redoxin domain-containing protein n=1 Tax=Sphingomonas sp. SRS2 TaxID=133190 RepID=UPI000618408E|nr:redoxin domain-containing protein [Sphingomonas sp. SRS2]KKC24715.1 peroxiredoxin [Sphingomonas sp. SRS2]